MIEHQLGVVASGRIVAPVLWHRTITYEACGFPLQLLEALGYQDWVAKINPFEESTYDTAVMCIPGASSHDADDYKYLNEISAKFDRVIFLIFGDEEAKFIAANLTHPKAIIWWFAPPYFGRQREVDRPVPFGQTLNASSRISILRRMRRPARDFAWCFLGQVTHERRQQCKKAAMELPNGLFSQSFGFMQGINRDTYFESMLQSKFALCPSGPMTPDSFRFAEALECGCIPIVDGLAPRPHYPLDYWEYVLGEKAEHLPFPIIYDWSSLGPILDYWLRDYDTKAERCQKWWLHQKYQWARRLGNDLCGLEI